MRSSDGSLLETELLCEFDLKVSQVTRGDLFSMLHILFKSVSSFSFDLQLLHVCHLIIDWVLSEKVANENFFDVALLVRDAGDCVH